MKKQMLLLLCIMTCLLAGCSKMELDVTEANLKMGETLQLHPSTDDTPVVYSSDNTSVATVDENGCITPIGEGIAQISAENSKGKTAVCAVTVDRVEPSEISFQIKSFQLLPGETTDTEIVFQPSYVTVKEVSYMSSDESVATVDSSGVITATAPGEAIITAKSENGKTDTCVVTVPPYISSIQMQQELHMLPGDSVELAINFSPENSIKEDVIWSSSDESVATVDSGTVTAVEPGTATITAETENTKCTAECTVYVDRAPLSIHGLSLSKSSMIIGSQYQVTFTASAAVSGGAEGDYLYLFELLQNGNLSRSSGWTATNAFSGSVSGNGTCILRVSVKDSDGTTDSLEQDLLE